jgi:hypothetical protein
VAHPLFNLVLPNQVRGLDHLIKSFMVSCEVPSRNGKNPLKTKHKCSKKSTYYIKKSKVSRATAILTSTKWSPRCCCQLLLIIHPVVRKTATITDKKLLPFGVSESGGETQLGDV